MQHVWREISDILQNSINPGLFTVWIKPLEATVTSEGLTLAAPNDFVAVWVRDRLLESIQEAAAAVLGETPKIDIVVAQGGTTPVAAPQPTGRPLRARQAPLPLEAPQPGSPGYRWKFTFADFVVGPSNELAYAAAKGLCEETMAADQLFLSSTPGLGKTHLLQAVGQTLAERSNKENVCVEYMTGEEFARRWLTALRGNQLERFKARYRDAVDILLLEDVHFFQGKQKFQDELLATVNALQDRGAKVVFSSSFLPRELRDVDVQLASRFCSGFLALIEKPDFFTRVRILKQKAATFQVNLPDDVAEMLADRLVSDVRQLESCLQNLVLKAKLLNKHITMDLASQVLGAFSVHAASLNMEGIIEFICASYDISACELNSRSRQRRIVQARNTAFFLARKHTELSLKEIGDRFNRRHSTVLKGIANVEREMELETPLGRQLRNTVNLATRLGAHVRSPNQTD